MSHSLKKLVTAAAIASASVVGVAGSAAAAPSPYPDPLAPITDFAARAAAGDIAAPQGMSGQVLVAAFNAGLPVVEAVRVFDVSGGAGTGPGSPSVRTMVEFRRVFDPSVLGSPTTKFVTVGGPPLNDFYQKISGPVFDPTPYVNMRQDEWGPRFDIGPGQFRNSPIVQLPGGGPGVGAALILP